MSVNEAWLARRTETALEPALPIIDPHHHLWEYPGDSYTERELLADMRSGHNVVATVYVECGHAHLLDGPEHMRPLGEVQHVQAVAERCAAQGAPGACAGIVGHAKLQHGARIDELLAAQQAAAPTRFRGIRQLLAWDSDPRLLYPGHDTRPHLSQHPQWREGYAQLGNFGLSFDCWAYSTQLHELVDLARAFPDIPLVIDHMGGPLGVYAYAEPETRDHVLAHWRRRLAELASCPNVTLKLGGVAMGCIGLNMGPDHQAAPLSSEQVAALTADFHHTAIDLFSPSRCMFESNFPVDKAGIGATVLWNAFKRISARYTAEERADLFAGTAARTYRLDLDALHVPGATA